MRAAANDEIKERWKREETDSNSTTEEWGNNPGDAV
jgi:hypothetical protein